MNLTGTTAVTRGPQGTVSSVVVEDESLCGTTRTSKTVLIQALPQNLVSKVF